MRRYKKICIEIESTTGELFDHPNGQGWSLKEVFERMLNSRFDDKYCFGSTLFSSEHKSTKGYTRVQCIIKIKIE